MDCFESVNNLQQWNEEEVRQEPQKGSIIEALTHRKWTDKSTGHE
jgi:hypothetical protein